MTAECAESGDDPPNTSMTRGNKSDCLIEVDMSNLYSEKDWANSSRKLERGWGPYRNPVSGVGYAEFEFRLVFYSESQYRSIFAIVDLLLFFLGSPKIAIFCELDIGF